jgi:heat shock protein HslJ
VTLRYAAGSLQGRSGCNRYTAPVEQRPGRGAIAVGAIAATRMMCPAPADAIERRFLTALAGAKALELRDGRLGVVTTDADGRSTMLVFTPAAAP